MIAFTNKTITCKIFRENNHKCNLVINKSIDFTERILLGTLGSEFSFSTLCCGICKNYGNLPSLFWQKFRGSNVVSKDIPII